MQLPAGSLASACAVHAAGRKSGRPNADVNWAIATLSVSTICLTRRKIEELTAGRVGETIARFDQALGRTRRAHGHAGAMSGHRPISFVAGIRLARKLSRHKLPNSAKL